MEKSGVKGKVESAMILMSWVAERARGADWPAPAPVSCVLMLWPMNGEKINFLRDSFPELVIHCSASQLSIIRPESTIHYFYALST